MTFCLDEKPVIKILKIIFLINIEEPELNLIELDSHIKSIQKELILLGS